ncbi:MAG: iron-containing alcohol dehydrogenase [Oscillospiraceae bacterium]|jgi:glycerol-1-phosphate dehydrogenase [NAD(P)+]|nr:iron-containing alcohol dehydrogenase [Oscillospiraceae bacterium]
MGMGGHAGGLDLGQILSSLQNCPCGREHTTQIEQIIVESGAAVRLGALLCQFHFPKTLLLVADKNTLAAAEGVLQSLDEWGFVVKPQIFDDLRTADMREVELIEALSAEVGGILSVGSGSNNDICRLASARAGKDLCIFATAASMDGFASDAAPITYNNFKHSYPARQPRLLIADTAILAAAPKELKSAGFGDMMGKYIGLADWRVAHLLIGEYYCPRVAALTKQAADRIFALAGRITEQDEEAAAEVFEALVLTGLGMGFTHNSRPASGAEHVVSHFWECKKLEHSLVSDFHGKKVGVATLACMKIYGRLAETKEILPVREQIDWDEVYSAYGEVLSEAVRPLHDPTTTEKITTEKLKEAWPEIRRVIKELPPYEAMRAAFAQAGAAAEKEEIGVDAKLFAQGFRFSPFMRDRLTLLRLLPMLQKDWEELYG